MGIENARGYFQALAARGSDPRLADAVGAWEFEVEGAGTWTVAVDRGVLNVSEAPPPQEPGDGAKPTAKLCLSEEELVRLARGADHENLFMAVIRGAITFEGELAFANRLRELFPLSDEELRKAS